MQKNVEIRNNCKDKVAGLASNMQSVANSAGSQLLEVLIEGNSRSVRFRLRRLDPIFEIMAWQIFTSLSCVWKSLHVTIFFGMTALNSHRACISKKHETRETMG